MHSSPFYSADKHVMYVTMSNGERRRVERDGDRLTLVERKGKAWKKADKRARQAAQ